MSGFVTIARSYFEHEFWKERRAFSKAEAWLDLIQSANWEDGSVIIKMQRIEVKRGQLAASIRYLKSRWGWGSNGKVSRFLEMLQKMEMIRAENGTHVTLITLCKYDTYNNTRSTDGTETERQRNTNGTLTEQQRNKEKKNNNNNKNNNDDDRPKIETKATPEQWAQAVTLDEVFVETCRKHYDLTADDFTAALARFYETKKALGQLNHTGYKDFRSNFFFWLQKQDFRKSKSTTNDNGYLISEENYNSVLADLLAEGS